MATRDRGASSRSLRVAAACARARKNQLQRSTVKMHVVVINWENVLAPLDWLAVHLGLDRTVESIQRAQLKLTQSPALLPKLASIEERVMELLLQVQRHANGPTFIVSEHTTAYVELVSSVFFPRLTAALRSVTTGIYVVGTPDTELSELELTYWKGNLLGTIMLEGIFADKVVSEASELLARPGSGEIGVVALCGKEVDVVATKRIHLAAPYAVIKRAQLGTGSFSSARASLEAFGAQVAKFTDFVTRAIELTQSIDVTL